MKISRTLLNQKQSVSLCHMPTCNCYLSTFFSFGGGRWWIWARSSINDQRFRNIKIFTWHFNSITLSKILTYKLFKLSNVRTIVYTSQNVLTSAKITLFERCKHCFCKYTHCM